MKRKKVLSVFALSCMLIGSFAGCGGKGKGKVLPTIAPTPTTAPLNGQTGNPTPTTPPDSKYTKIFKLNGEDYNQITSFTATSGIISVKDEESYSGKYSFKITGRENEEHGVSMNYADTKGNTIDVVGKKTHLAVWVFQETGAPATFAVSLSVKKQDNSTDTPTIIEVPNVPSNVWYLIEKDIDVFSGIKSPSVTLAMTSSRDDFYFDDIRLTYDPDSYVDNNGMYGVAATELLYFTFEDGQTHLSARGDGVNNKLANSGNNSEVALQISKRTANWHGAQLDLKEYNFAGKKLYISYDAKNADSEKTEIKCTMEQKLKDSLETTYPSVGSSETVGKDKWTTVKATYDVPENVDSLIIYFETPGTGDFYLDNIAISTRDLSNIDLKTVQPDENGIVLLEKETEKINTAGFTQIHYLSGDTINDELSLVNARGTQAVKLNKNGHSGNSFLISGRTASWNGASVGFTDIKEKEYNVLGKNVFVSFWVYQETGELMEVSATLQVNKPDGSQAWPERANKTNVPSGKWTYIEGIIPVYANAAAPTINFEMPTSDKADFLLDDITIMVDLNSNVPDNPEYVVKEQVEFTSLKLNFEDNNVVFAGRGNGRCSIVQGGHASDKCLKVSDRAATWHGAEADLSAYNLAGKTVQASIWVYHRYDDPIQLKFTAMQNDGSNDQYDAVIEDTEVYSGKWVHLTGEFTFASTAKKCSLIVESPDNETAEFYVDDVEVTLVK